MVYSIVITDRSFNPYALKLITDSGVDDIDTDHAEDMMRQRTYVLNTLATDSAAIVKTRSNVKPSDRSLVVYSFDDPPPPEHTAGLRPETLYGPWTLNTCVSLVRRLNAGSVIIAPDQPRFQEIKLLVLPPKSELSKAIRKCILEISEAQAIIDKATTTLDTINTDA